MRQLLIIPLLLVLGCTPYLRAASAESSTSATNAAVAALASPDNQQKLDNLASSASGAAIGAIINDDTTKKLRDMVAALGVDLSTQLEAIMKQWLADILAAAPELREALVGQALRDDIDAMVPHLTAAIQASIATARAPVVEEEAKMRNLAIGLGVAAAGLLCSLGVAMHVLRSHRKTIDRLMEKL